MMENERILKARLGLAKLANTEFPAPILDLLTPTLDAADPVIGEALKLDAAEESEELKKFLKKETDIPVCVLPSLPDIRMTYIDRRNLRGIVEFEEVV